MSFEISSVTQNPGVAQTTATSAASKTSEVKADKTVETVKEDVGAVYEKGQEQGKGAYSINKMSKEDRDALVTQLKADAEKRQSQLLDLVQKTITGQVGAYSKATGDDIWNILSSGKFTVDSATKAQAQEDISEDGYWGVKQTSERIFDFAKALSGGDPSKMEDMRKAFEKGFKQATNAWGDELPQISQDTYAAVQKMFDDYANQEGN
jgi:hypothetical protein